MAAVTARSVPAGARAPKPTPCPPAVALIDRLRDALARAGRAAGAALPPRVGGPSLGFLRIPSRTGPSRIPSSAGPRCLRSGHRARRCSSRTSTTALPETRACRSGAIAPTTSTRRRTRRASWSGSFPSSACSPGPLGVEAEHPADARRGRAPGSRLRARSGRRSRARVTAAKLPLEIDEHPARERTRRYRADRGQGARRGRHQRGRARRSRAVKHVPERGPASPRGALGDRRRRDGARRRRAVGHHPASRATSS